MSDFLYARAWIMGSAAVAVVLLIGAVAAGDSALLPRRAVTPAHLERARSLARGHHSTLTAVQITASDGAALAGWHFDLPQPRGIVLLLHGQADNSAGMLGYADLFLRHEFAVLAADSRAHGASGGDLATYGVLERGDLSRWAEWFRARHNRIPRYALGESMGAAILLTSLSDRRMFCAVAAESPFSTFNTIAEYRVHQSCSYPPLARGFVALALACAWVRYGIDLRLAAPETALAGTRTPVLLIHGSGDTNIPPEHSRALLRRAGGPVELWIVPGALHSGAFGAAPTEFERRVVGWFERFACS